MARIRSIKPEFWASEKVGKMTVLARFTFVGLWSLADDDGRGRGNRAYLRAQLHPYSSDIDDADFSAALVELAQARLVQFYAGDDGCAYYYVPGFSEHQKIDKRWPSKLPAPPPLPDKSASLPNQSESLPDKSALRLADCTPLERNGMERRGEERERAPAPLSGSVAADLAEKYRRTHPGIINQDSATKQVQFALDAGVRAAVAEPALTNDASKGKKIWEILDPLIDAAKHGSGKTLSEIVREQRGKRAEV